MHLGMSPILNWMDDQLDVLLVPTNDLQTTNLLFARLLIQIF